MRVGKSAGGGVAVRALEGGGADVVVEAGWWHQVGGVERLLVVVVGVLGVVEAGLVAQGGGRRGGAGLLVPATWQVEQIRILVRVRGVVACSGKGSRLVAITGTGP